MRRSGFHLVELLVAVGLMAFPVLCSLGLVVANHRASGLNDQQLLAEGIVIDVLELLCAGPISRVREIASDATGFELAHLLERRAEELPETAGADLARRMVDEATHVAVSLEEGLGSAGDLAVVTVELRSPSGGSVRLARLVHTPARTGRGAGQRP